MNRPFHQFFSHLFPVLAAVAVPGDQRLAVGIESFQIQHMIGAAECEFDVRVDLDAQGAVRREIRLIIAEEYQAEAGCQPRQTGHSLPQVRVFPPRNLKRYDFVYCIAHLIMQIGGFQKAALLVQYHGVGWVYFHDQIVHFQFPPFVEIIRHRCPRMIS